MAGIHFLIQSVEFFHVFHYKNQIDHRGCGVFLRENGGAIGKTALQRGKVLENRLRQPFKIDFKHKYYKINQKPFHPFFLATSWRLYQSSQASGSRQGLPSLKKDHKGKNTLLFGLWKLGVGRFGRAWKVFVFQLHHLRGLELGIASPLGGL